MNVKRYVIIGLVLFVVFFTVGFIVSCSLSKGGETETARVNEEAEAAPVEVEETPPVAPAEKTPEPPITFDAQKAYETVRLLSQEIGIRVQGSSQEKLAADSLMNILETYGCDQVYEQSFTLPDYTTSQNVIAVVEGVNPAYSVVIGGHIDSRNTTPGANDNASGAATTMELARVFAHNGSYPTLIFILFGSEEDHGEITEGHLYCHYGSRHYVSSMTVAEKGRLIGMFSLDMVGYGNGLYARYMGIGPMKLVNMINEYGNGNGFPLGTMKCGNLSDHEPFEKAGIPSVWMEYMINGSSDPAVHKPEDNLSHVSVANLQYTGGLLEKFIESLDQLKCEELKAAKSS